MLVSIGHYKIMPSTTLFIDRCILCRKTHTHTHTYTNEPIMLYFASEMMTSDIDISW